MYILTYFSFVGGATENVNFRAIGFFNEADTFESSLILIYYGEGQGIHAQGDRHNAV
jgi:hypothetical protein